MLPRSSPLRRAVAAMGLLVLVPIALRLLRGQLSLPEAATRAAVTLLAVIVVVRVLSALLARAAQMMERAAVEEQSPL